MLLDALRVVLPNVLVALSAAALAIPFALLLATAAPGEEGEEAKEVAERAKAAALLLTTEACALCTTRRALRGTRIDLFMSMTGDRGCCYDV